MKYKVNLGSFNVMVGGKLYQFPKGSIISSPPLPKEVLKRVEEEFKKPHGAIWFSAINVEKKKEEPKKGKIPPPEPQPPKKEK